MNQQLEINSCFSQENFCKQIHYSPDGSMLVASTEEGDCFCFENKTNSQPTSIHDIERISLPRGEPIYDCKWYPFMSAQDPSTCCFITTCKDHPIQMWSASASLRCTYKGHNELDELDSPYSLTFNLHGSKIYAGSNRMIR